MTYSYSKTQAVKTLFLKKLIFLKMMVNRYPPTYGDQPARLINS